MQAMCASADPDGATDWSPGRRHFPGRLFLRNLLNQIVIKPFIRSDFLKTACFHNPDHMLV
eukprot:scaffold6616_cov15-Tisochrysis_lutea.AAC.1